MRASLILLTTFFLFIGCTQDQPTPFHPESEFGLQEQDQQNIKESKEPPRTGFSAGSIEDDEKKESLDSSKLQKANDLDALLNSGERTNSAMAKPQKVSKKYSYEFEFEFGYTYEYDYEYDYYYDYGSYYGYEYDEDYYYYYDYGSYYDDYYYVYEEYDEIDYSTNNYWSDYDYFGHYYNYRDRSSYEVWATYDWPNGYGAVKCYAQSLLGDIYWGFGFPAVDAEDQALNACYDDDSWYCYSLGCN